MADNFSKAETVDIASKVSEPLLNSRERCVFGFISDAIRVMIDVFNGSPGTLDYERLA
jgi:hypothetical protein